MNVIIVGMLAYTARLLGYSFISDPAYVYPFEALEGLTMALMMTSAVTYVAKISEASTLASVMGLMGALFFGVGKGSGSLFGGLLMSAFGAPATFRTLAVTALICSILYGFFQWLYVKPRRILASDDGASTASPGNDQVNICSLFKSSIK
jgi:MFS family permease